MKPGNLIFYEPPGALQPIVGILVENIETNPKKRWRLTKPAYRMKLLGQEGVEVHDVYFGPNMPLIIDDHFQL